MDKASVKAMEMGARARQERQIMALLRKQNPYVVRLYFSFHTAHHLFFVVEYVPGSDCAAMLRAYGSLPEGTYVRMYVRTWTRAGSTDRRTWAA